MSSQPGRTKGTRIAWCKCGRRVAGSAGETTKCPDCGRAVPHPKTKPTRKGKRPLVFLKSKKS